MWNYEMIENDETDYVKKNFSELSREELEQELIKTRVALYTMTYSLSGLDCVREIGKYNSAFMECGLIPLMEEDGIEDKFLICRKIDGEIQCKYEKVEERNYYNENIELHCSVQISDSSLVPDEFRVLNVYGSAMCACINYGGITMGDIRNASKVLGWSYGAKT